MDSAISLSRQSQCSEYLVWNSRARAACDIDGDTFYLHKNDETHHTAKTDLNGCNLHLFRRGRQPNLVARQSSPNRRTAI